jgi:hypothetical protein
MEKNIKAELETYCELHWWNMGTKTLSFKGSLGNLLKEQHITFTKRKTEREGIFVFHFKSVYGISYKTTGSMHDFTHLAKQAIQMELVRMGDKSQLYVTGSWRPIVNVNF